MLYTCAEGIADHILLYAQILHYEVGAILGVGHYAAYMCCGEHNCHGAFAVEKVGHGGSVEQIELGMAAAYHICESTGFEVGHYRRANESAMAGYIYFVVFIEHCR